ncbi:rRNA maturation RNase YbeY [Fodinibius halophilus]|uniref:Endoribonuclease YbeY n=1 Tax=Fodinibius halophilus TaxID=1736908 RepID=A0A6M1T5I8_9BACT|nr:rRNA maturation RNase YbeY [Fodinibius halophilus]NGP87913.1 rRNA maturation RNase YbeY [Fodinibius halophilus]
MASPSADIQVFNQTESDIPIAAEKYSSVASTLFESEGCAFNFVEVVYVDENEIVRINKEYLERDYVTDIITFRYDESPDNQAIEGTMFCCAPRIRQQAAEFNESPKEEFLRIYIHGLLHLAGYEDKTDKQKQQMTAKENEYLGKS